MDSAADTPSLGWVAPFGDPRITACSRLPGAFRSVPRPSSPLGAKASTRCPCFPRPPAAATAKPSPTRSAIARGPPARAPTGRTKRGECGRCCRKGFQRLPQRAVLARNGPHTHARCAPCPQTEDQKKGRTRDLPMPAAHDAQEIAPPCPQRAPHHHLTMSKQQGPAPSLAGGWTRLVGLGRLERPTSRLSGVRSNQLSYRPKIRGRQPEAGNQA